MNEERYKKWFAEAKEQTIETLPAFMKKILDEPQDYESIVEAIAACAIGAAWAADNSPNGGITGFQGSFVMWNFITHWMGFDNNEPIKLVRYEEMLYPQYGFKYEKVISKDTWDWLRKKATDLWLEGGGVQEVRDHWRSIMDGNVPFGYKVKEN